MKKIFLVITFIMLVITGYSQGFRNPVLPGFHADPSVCRAGDDFYLVNSTFQYYPGVPVFHSKDLIHWEQVGACLTRESQVRIEGMDEQTGIYAPTIRYHEGRFYMVTTVYPSRKHFYVYTDDPKGEWSDPIYIDFCVGSCDPTLYFEDGRCYFLWKEGDIKICEIDVKTGKQLGEIHHLGVGLGGRYPEGPHIYKKDGYYYLLLAEGGTEHGHHVNILRSKNLFGPYESNPANPILSHFNMKMQNSPIQGIGHADLVQAPDGSWWMICLAYRTHGYLQHVMGRETFLAPVTWEEGGWPVVNGRSSESRQARLDGRVVTDEGEANGDGTLQLDMHCQTLPQVPMPAEPSRDEFDTDKLSLYWSHLNMPQKENYSLTDRKGWLRLKTSTITLDEVGNPTFIGHRQSEADFTATTKVDVSGLKDGGVAGITAYAAHHNHYDVQVVARDGKRYVQAKIRIGEMEHIEKEIPINEDIVYLRITADPQFYHLLYSTDNKEFIHLARQGYRYLSTETIGGFCGVHIGIFAHTLSSVISHADFDWTDLKFVYKE